MSEEFRIGLLIGIIVGLQLASLLIVIVFMVAAERAKKMIRDQLDSYYNSEKEKRER